MSGKLFVVTLALAATMSLARVTPQRVRQDVAQGETIVVQKTISLDGMIDSRVMVDVCFVQDATQSFAGDKCAAIRDSIPAITDLFIGTDVRYALKTFKDYNDNEEVFESRIRNAEGFQLEQAYAEFCLEPPSGGGDDKEAQYDAIVKAASTGPDGCGWREGSTRIMVAITDSGCKGPAFGPQYINSRDSTKAALAAEEIVFIGVTTGGLSTNCFTPFADATGGVIEEVGEFDDLADNVADALAEATFSITPSFTSQCNALEITYDPPAPWALKEGESITVQETITVLATPPTFLSCNVEFSPAGLQRVRLDVKTASCGNGIREADEQCDDTTESCDSDCTCAQGFRFNRAMQKCVKRCGNGRVERRFGEECDGTPFCSKKCQCRGNFTPVNGRCQCIGGSIVGGRCIL